MMNKLYTFSAVYSTKSAWPADHKSTYNTARKFLSSHIYYYYGRRA